MTFLRSSSSRNKRILTIVVFFILAIVATSVGTPQTPTQQEASDINNELEKLRSKISIQYIFGNKLLSV